MKDTLPNLIIIGAMKAGTSSLFDYLSKHPDIYLPKQKELNFFIEEENYSHGISWFKKKFNSTYKVNAYASPDYTKKHIYKGVAERMSKTIPNVKLIYLLRNPVDRLLSHYHHVKMNNLTQKSIQEIFNDIKSTDSFKTSLYYYQISEYLKYFDRSQILMVKSEDLRNNRVHTMTRIFDFLEIDSQLNLNFDYETHVTSKRGRKPLILSTFLGSKIGQKMKVFLPASMKLSLANLFESEMPFPKITDQQRKKLELAFRDDLLALEKEWDEPLNLLAE